MRTFVFTLVAAALALASSGATAQSVRVVGHLQNTIVLPIGLSMTAKMDTGADMTSIHAVNIEKYRKGGRDWVRFNLEAGGRSVTVRRPVVRIVRIRRAGVGVVERPVVELGLCIAGYYKLAHVNLTDRSRMSYPLLVGNRYLRTGGLAIDPGSEYDERPVCD